MAIDRGSQYDGLDSIHVLPRCKIQIVVKICGFRNFSTPSLLEKIVHVLDTGPLRVVNVRPYPA